ncbi:hypothetical protein [Synechococcus sp. MIT S9501]|uniref:hypothetical protein n=1 Tax=Synechococcus sp. MIT S9501 TaxID=3082545 RepID=UPI0039B408C6
MNISHKLTLSASNHHQKITTPIKPIGQKLTLKNIFLSNIIKAKSIDRWYTIHKVKKSRHDKTNKKQRDDHLRINPLSPFPSKSPSPIRAFFSAIPSPIQVELAGLATRKCEPCLSDASAGQRA